MNEIYKRGAYSVCERANGRLCIQYHPSKGDSWVCASYERTREGLTELKNDLVEFLVMDKAIRKSIETAVETEIKEAIGA